MPTADGHERSRSKSHLRPKDLSQHLRDMETRNNTAVESHGDESLGMQGRAISYPPKQP